MAASRRALPIAELRSLGGPAALERCLQADGASIEEGGVVVGWQHEHEQPGPATRDRIWLSGLLTERSGLVLLAESDVLRRSAELLVAFGAEDAVALGSHCVGDR